MSSSSSSFSFPLPAHRSILFSLNSFPADAETRDDSGLLWGGAAAPCSRNGVPVVQPPTTTTSNQDDNTNSIEGPPDSCTSCGAK
jgi:hypothetical protein